MDEDDWDGVSDWGEEGAAYHRRSVLSADEVAALMLISKSSVMRLERRGELVGVRVGDDALFARAAYAAYIASISVRRKTRDKEPGA